MVIKNTNKSIKLLVFMTSIVTPVAILLWCNRDEALAFVNFVRDGQAVRVYLDSLGVIGPLVLMGLIGLQVLIPSLPAEPPMIAGAYVYGFTSGFLMNWLVSVTASQAVFYLARYAGRPVVEYFIPADLLDKWTRKAAEKGTVFFLLGFVIPPIPSDILIYVAGLSVIDGRRFFVANLFGRLPMVILLSLVGAEGLRITPTVIIGLTFIGIIMMAVWWYFVMYESQTNQSTDSTTDILDTCDNSQSIGMRRSYYNIRNQICESNSSIDQALVTASQPI